MQHLIPVCTKTITQNAVSWIKSFIFKSSSAFSLNFKLYIQVFFIFLLFCIRVRKKLALNDWDRRDWPEQGCNKEGRKASGSSWYFKVSESLWQWLVYDADVKHHTQWGLCPALRPWQWENCPLLVGRPIHLVREALPLPFAPKLLCIKDLLG